MTLPSYDPDWYMKLEALNAELRDFDGLRFQEWSPEEKAHVEALHVAVAKVYQSMHRTPNEYVRAHLHPVLAELKDMGILPSFPDMPVTATLENARWTVADALETVEEFRRTRPFDQSPRPERSSWLPSFFGKLGRKLVDRQD